MSRTRVGIVGCTGRMGRALARLAVEDQQLQLAAAVTRADDPQIGADLGRVAGIAELGIAVSAACPDTLDVLIEFTAAEVTPHWAAFAAKRGLALVSGTTGLSDSQHAALAGAATRVPVVWAPNMSVGVNVLLGLVRTAARSLTPDWDVELVESHHRHKTDAPSGTASALLAAVTRGAGGDVRYGRSAHAPRAAGEIGVHSVRLGGIVGDHEVHFGSMGEVVTLSHRALSRDIFALGALRAAKWIVGRPARLYAMQDVLGLD